MKKNHILEEFFQEEQLVDLMASLDSYRSASDILKQSYIAMGRKGKIISVTSSSTHGTINVKGTRSTAKI